MNYLAHAYLSFGDPLLIVGNMIADFVKGRQWQQYEAGIQRGIQLHRAIDEFTDRHPATLEAREYFQPSCGRYSAVFMDLVYDHFLAADETHFSDSDLALFATEVYQVLQEHESSLPPDFLEVFHYMRTYNWLYHYRQKDGIYRSFNGIVHRAKYLDITVDVPFAVLEANYQDLARSYRAFFPDVVAFVKKM